MTTNETTVVVNEVPAHLVQAWNDACAEYSRAMDEFTNPHPFSNESGVQMVNKADERVKEVQEQFVAHGLPKPELPDVE